MRQPVIHELLASTQFVLAQVSWATGEHSRARGLARTARDVLLASTVGHEARLAEVEQWLAAHPGAQE